MIAPNMGVTSFKSSIASYQDHASSPEPLKIKEPIKEDSEDDEVRI